jgi:hypothetical protein
MVKNSNVIIAFSLCFLVSNNNLHGMELLTCIFGCKQVRRQMIIEKKEFDTVSTCKEYIRSIDEDVNKSAVDGICKILYIIVGDDGMYDGMYEAYACVHSYDHNNPNSISISKNPLSLEQQFDDELKRENLDLAQQQSVCIKAFMCYDVIQPS